MLYFQFINTHTFITIIQKRYFLEGFEDFIYFKQYYKQTMILFQIRGLAQQLKAKNVTKKGGESRPESLLL